ncbi:MAG TPA: rod shape-determining protein MreC [Patescibacteria group bacterium]|nr:rod shape-determining protein MreC [Patescibacteria group bacterium]
MSNDSLRKIFPFFLLLVFISIFFFLFDYFGWLTGVTGFFERPFLFIERPFYSVYQSVNQSFNQLADRNESQQIAELQVELRQLALDQNKLTTCLEENEYLKKLLGTSLPSAWQFKMVRVIGLTEQLKIDLGRSKEVEVGMNLVSENIYVGRVVMVNERESLVQLPTDPNSRIPVVIKQPGATGFQARGLLIGKFGGQLVLERVLQEEDIRQGDLIVTSGEEGYLPDLVIGQIKEVNKGTAEIYQQAVVSPLLDYSSLRFVFLVIP